MSGKKLLEGGKEVKRGGIGPFLGQAGEK